MLPPTNATHWLTLHGLVTLLAVLVYVVSSHAMHQRRPPASAIAWMLFIVLLPYLALPAYLVFGSRKLARPSGARAALPAGADRPDRWAVDTILALGQPAPTTCEDLHLHADGQAARDALFRVIEGAQERIDICTFILGNDTPGPEVVARLAAKARQGVRVRLLLDGLGSLMQRPVSLAPLTAAGGQVQRFVPPLHSPLKGRTNLRNHRKMLIADAGLPAARLWCGGRNLAAEYFTGAAGKPAWRDLSFDVGTGLVQQAANLFARDWAFASGQAAPAGLGEPAVRVVPQGGAQLVASGPDQADDTVLALLVMAAYRARGRIALATPYFVPDPSLLMALSLAARRGVVVDLLVPARSNHRLSDLARGRGLRALAQAGGRIWMTQDMMHAKLAVFDEVLALAGSANLDSRSLLLNYELMCAFHGQDDVRRFGDWFEHERQRARPWAAKPPGLARDLAEGMLLWLGFQL
ncbi:phospholipase D-like domain-containing protein [Hydrogenophaga sp.]|uniref:phospholipase D-like domain-containing protein n=1 Tax=Hydrogenophaga sp. TaxID=1904254 RepID=UPI002628E7DA|nr:phospholipase D-like domain-containing protein [Hydrogenophaga sp.]MCW5654812.1 PLDc N-terminal domain-containing protein [Hydrogenophaga sp.]